MVLIIANTIALPSRKRRNPLICSMCVVRRQCVSTRPRPEM
jgi:hypothetical protein